MALAVIGGLVFSTVLSLVFVPAMFLMMDDVGNFFWRIGKKLIVSSADSDDPLPMDHAAPAAPHGGPPPVPETPPPPPAADAPPSAAAAAAASH
jgi:hypothetical protein